MKNILLEGYLKINQQEGGYCQAGIQIGEHNLDDVILEYCKKDFGPLRDPLNLGKVRIEIEFLNDGK